MELWQLHQNLASTNSSSADHIERRNQKRSANMTIPEDQREQNLYPKINVKVYNTLVIKSMIGFILCPLFGIMGCVMTYLSGRGGEQDAFKKISYFGKDQYYCWNNFTGHCRINLHHLGDVIL